MSMFIWFAIIFTVVYIIYYTVMIMNDLYGKTPDEKENIEEIDVPTSQDVAIPDEIPIAVVESDSGFSVGEETYEASPVNDEPQETEQTASEETPEEPQQASIAENIRQAAEGRSESIDVEWEDAKLKDQFKKTLLNKGSDRLGRPTVKTELVHDAI